MEPAVAEYLTIHQGGDHHWVSRFVCPVGRLSELEQCLPESVEEPWSITVIGSEVGHFKEDLKLIDVFEKASGEQALVEAFEVKVSEQSLTPGAARNLQNAHFDEFYLEVPWGEALIPTLHAIAKHESFGAKARTGGLTPEAFPSCEDLATFLHECLSLDLTFKCTAGLHHPLPFHDPAIGARHHGFLNVFIGVALALTHDLSRNELIPILQEEDPNAFWFTEKGLGFRDYEADLDDLEESREFLRSFGSCSVAEPIEGLQKLLQTTEVKG